MSVAVKMQSTFASPDLILLEGKCYKLPDELAAELMKDGSGQDSKPAAIKAPKDAKFQRIPTSPDPGDKDDVDEKES